MSVEPHGDGAHPGTRIVSDLIAERLQDLRPAERRVARTLLADYPIAGLRTTASLAQDAGVSAPSVLRFSHALGFDSFRTFQSALTEELRRDNLAPLGRMPWQRESGSESELLLERARTLTDDAMASLSRVPPTEIETAIELLSDGTRNLLITGGRFSGVLASHLATNLEQIRPRVRLVQDPYGTQMAQIIDLRARDVWMLFDFHPYQDSTVQLATEVKRAGGTVILVTDQRLSPAAVNSDVVLPISVDAPSPFHSLSTGILLVELLVVPVLQRIGENGEIRMSRWETVRDRELLQQKDERAG